MFSELEFGLKDFHVVLLRVIMDMSPCLTRLIHVTLFVGSPYTALTLAGLFPQVPGQGNLTGTFC